eukprot:10748870-Alexandrium_andersonii.AAC.1
MSASLVGSEMCIRDRQRPSWVKRHGSTLQRRQPRSAASCVANQSPTVSYTHLTLPTICSV